MVIIIMTTTTIIIITTTRGIFDHPRVTGMIVRNFEHNIRGRWGLGNCVRMIREGAK